MLSYKRHSKFLIILLQRKIQQSTPETTNDLTQTQLQKSQLYWLCCFIIVAEQITLSFQRKIQQ